MTNTALELSEQDGNELEMIFTIDATGGWRAATTTEVSGAVIRLLSVGI